MSFLEKSYAIGFQLKKVGTLRASTLNCDKYSHFNQNHLSSTRHSIRVTPRTLRPSIHSQQRKEIPLTFPPPRP